MMFQQICKKVIIAYEPIWAIGTGKTASSEAEEVCKAIREVVAEIYDSSVAKQSAFNMAAVLML